MRLAENLFASQQSMLGFAGDLVEEVLEQITAVDGWSNGGASEHLQALVQERLRLNTSSFEGIPGVCEMMRGTGAGNPIADLLFSHAFGKLVKLLRLELGRIGLGSSVPCSGAASFFGWSDEDEVVSVDVPDVSFADGLATATPVEAVAVE